MAREYKDSGIEWIGQIPKEWKFGYLKNYYNFEKGKNAQLYTKDYIGTKRGKYPVFSGQTENNGIMGLIDSYDYDVDECIFTTTVGAKVMTPKLLKGRFSLSQNCLIMRRKTSDVINSYIYYLLFPLFGYYKSLLPSHMQPSLRIEDLCTYSFFLPPMTIQQKIAVFLDKVCGEVDEMVALQETMIEELKAYKQSVITEAVTKGLNPNAPMRDSGIDWIGEIPEHWGMPAIGYLAKITSGSTPDRNNPLFWSEGTVNWIKTGELQNNRLSCSEEKVTEYALNNTSIKLYPKDTILMAMYGQGKTRGMTALLDVPCTTNQACAALSIYNKNVNVLFLWKCLIGAYDAIRDKAVGTGQPNLNIDLISKFVIPLPPYNEQAEIVAFIDEIVPQIDSLIALKQAKIEELKEYKKSVIYEYVTGKKEVV